MPLTTELRWDGKYDAHGKRVLPLRVKLPFQTVETVNESTRDRQTLFRTRPDAHPWRNRLIWGDKKYVLPALLDEFAGKVNLIYIDPPFDTGADFSFTAAVPDAPDDADADPLAFTKEPSIIEQKAYRDTWGRGLDSYLQWFYETVTILHELLAENGGIYVHLDWHVGHYAKLLLDEVFGQENFRNEIYWYYYNKMPDIRKGVFPRATDSLFFYVKNKHMKYPFHPPPEKRDHTVKQLVRKKLDGRMVNARDEAGNVLYQEREERIVDNVWRLSMLQPADKTENLLYPTQKPQSILDRILKSSSNEEDLILDCFCGSGTTAAVAEKLNRRWIACDLGRFAVHTTRKRLLNIENVRPFVVQNLGKYERQHWQTGAFAPSGEPLAGARGWLERQRAYIEFMLRLYHATPLAGRTLLHGVKNGRLVHVGGVDAPVSDGDIRQIAAEFKRAVGTGKDAPTSNGVDVLGWDFAFEVNEVARQQAERANVHLRFLRIPRDVMDKRAVDQGDVKFFELAALSVAWKAKRLDVTLSLTDFIIPSDDVPEEVRTAVTHWSQWIDYWAVDWDHGGDAFHNEWQTFRTRKQPKLMAAATHTYEKAGEYNVMVKVIDILGNDTTKTVKVAVK